MGSSSQSEEYVLRGGRAGAERLRVLNRVKWPTTEPLLKAAGLRAGMSCLDVGCGGGDVTLKMAALVGARATSLESTATSRSCISHVRRPKNRVYR